MSKTIRIKKSRSNTVVQISHQVGKVWTLAIANKNASKTSKHRVEVGSRLLKWTAIYQLK